MDQRRRRSAVGSEAVEQRLELVQRARTVRNASALVVAVAGVYLLADVRLSGQPVGFVLAFANAALFALYIVLAHRVSRRPELAGIDELALAMLVACAVVTPIGVWSAAPAFSHAGLLAAGLGVGVSSSVLPYVFDQLAMARMARSTYALFVSLLPATAIVIGVIALAQMPHPLELAAVGLVVGGVAVHRERA